MILKGCVILIIFVRRFGLTKFFILFKNLFSKGGETMDAGGSSDTDYHDLWQSFLKPDKYNGNNGSYVCGVSLFQFDKP